MSFRLDSHSGLVLSSVSEDAFDACDAFRIEDQVDALANEVFEECSTNVANLAEIRSDVSALNPNRVSLKIGVEEAKAELVKCYSENILTLVQQFDENCKNDVSVIKLALEQSHPESILAIVKLSSEDLKNNIDLMSLALSRYTPYQDDLKLVCDLVSLFGDDAKNDTTLMMLALDKIYHETYCDWLSDIVLLCGPGIQNDPMQMCLILEKYVELMGQTKKHSEKYEILNKLSEPLKQDVIQSFQRTYMHINVGDDQVIPTIIKMLNDGGVDTTLRNFLLLANLKLAD